MQGTMPTSLVLLRWWPGSLRSLRSQRYRVRHDERNQGSSGGSLAMDYYFPVIQPYRDFEAYRWLKNAADHIATTYAPDINTAQMAYSLLATKASKIAAKYEDVEDERESA